MLNDEHIIKGCKFFQKNAQKALYEKYAPVLRGICIRYTNSRYEANDVLQDSFIKIYTNIKQYSGKGSFEGWLKRITVNTAINYYKSKKNYYLFNEDLNKDHVQLAHEDNEDSTRQYDKDNNLDMKNIVLNLKLSINEILEIINELPHGYKLVFNLFVIENYSHKEIADMLNIEVNTSKSQLSRAKKLLQKKLIEVCKIKTIA